VRKGDVPAVSDRSGSMLSRHKSRRHAFRPRPTLRRCSRDHRRPRSRSDRPIRCLNASAPLKKRGVHQAQLDDAVNAADTAKAKLVSAQKALAASEAQIGVIDAQKQNVIRRFPRPNCVHRPHGLVLARDATLGGVVSSSGRAISHRHWFRAGHCRPMSPKHRCENVARMPAEVSLPAAEKQIAVRSAASRPKSTGPPASARSAFRSLPGPRARAGNFAVQQSKFFATQRRSRSMSALVLPGL